MGDGSLFRRHSPALSGATFYSNGYLEQRLHVICFTPIEGGVRVISFRKANLRGLNIMKNKPLTNKSGEVRELTRKDIREMKPAGDVLPAELLAVLPKRKVGQRGPQKAPTKIALTLRYSPEVVDYFKETGEGWQTRIDEALKDWIKKHKHRAA